jgi:hypothetical protein
MIHLAPTPSRALSSPCALVVAGCWRRPCTGSSRRIYSSSAGRHVAVLRIALRGKCAVRPSTYSSKGVCITQLPAGACWSLGGATIRCLISVGEPCRVMLKAGDQTRQYIAELPKSSASLLPFHALNMAWETVRWLYTRRGNR